MTVERERRQDSASTPRGNHARFGASAEMYASRKLIWAVAFGLLLLAVLAFLVVWQLEIQVMDEAEKLVASLSIIESIDAKMDFTVHLQVEKPSGEFKASAEIYYYEDDNPQETPDPKTEGETHQLPNRVNIVDHRETTFVLGEQ